MSPGNRTIFRLRGASADRLRRPLVQYPGMCQVTPMRRVILAVLLGLTCSVPARSAGQDGDAPAPGAGGTTAAAAEPVVPIALFLEPDIVICDEPTTALDVVVQAQIINLMKIGRAKCERPAGWSFVILRPGVQTRACPVLQRPTR